jgi:hypothetical protein
LAVLVLMFLGHELAILTKFVCKVQFLQLMDGLPFGFAFSLPLL